MKKNNYFDILVLGAGASGLMLSSLLKKKSSVALIDANPKIGVKLAISGGGRCNITNERVSYKNYLGDRDFVREVLKGFDQNRLKKWLKYQGIELSLQKRQQLFCKDGSKAIVNLFRESIRGVNLFLGYKILSLNREGGEFVLTCDRGVFRAKKVVVATGGVSFPRLGASGVGFEIAREFGHRVSRLSPALVGFTLQREQFFMKELSGTSSLVRLRVEGREFEDNILFTHRGVSGPVILNASLYWERGSILIDFLPNFDLERIRGKKLLSSTLPLPKRVSKAMLNHLKIEDKTVNNLTPKDRDRLKLLKEYRLSPAGTFGFSRAEVTKGGVDCSEIDAKTMMSKIEKNLFFVGEVLDVAGELGGYNLQWAFSSAYLCSRYLNREND